MCAIAIAPHHLILVVFPLPATGTGTGTGTSAVPAPRLRQGADRPSPARPRGPHRHHLAAAHALRRTVLLPVNVSVTATVVRGATNATAIAPQPGEGDSHPVLDHRVPSPSADRDRARALHHPVAGVVSAVREGVPPVRAVDVGARQAVDHRHHLRRGGGVRPLLVREDRDVDGVRVGAGRGVRGVLSVVLRPLVRGQA